MEEVSMWLEIDDDLIIGVHSDKCDNDCLWVEFDGEANPGDRWHKNKVENKEFQGTSFSSCACLLLLLFDQSLQASIKRPIFEIWRSFPSRRIFSCFHSG
jgi:hypothetical protein